MAELAVIRGEADHASGQGHHQHHAGGITSKTLWGHHGPGQRYRHHCGRPPWHGEPQPADEEPPHEGEERDTQPSGHQTLSRISNDRLDQESQRTERVDDVGTEAQMVMAGHV